MSTKKPRLARCALCGCEANYYGDIEHDLFCKNRRVRSYDELRAERERLSYNCRRGRER